MDFMRLLKSFEELLYEITSWLVFYPLTLWRATTQPFRMMHYADSELDDRLKDRFADVLSPPLFLLITLLISHGIELGLVQRLDRANLPHLLDSDSNLLVMRALLFSIFPLAMAVALILGRSEPLTRETLRSPFYSQGYVAAPFALCLSTGFNLQRLGGDTATPLGIGFVLLALLWYGAVQIGWFRRDAAMGWLRAFIYVSIAFATASLLVILTGVVIVSEARFWSSKPTQDALIGLVFSGEPSDSREKTAHDPPPWKSSHDPQILLLH